MKSLDNGQEVTPVYLTEYYEPVGAHTQVALGAAAAVLTRPAGAVQIMVQVTAQNARFRLDGVDPTAAIGFQLQKEITPVIIGVAGADIRFFREAAGAVLEYQWQA
jgi:hypothetical protein